MPPVRDLAVIVIAFAGGYFIVSRLFAYMRGERREDPFEKDRREALGCTAGAGLDEIRGLFRESITEAGRRYETAFTEDQRDEIDRTVCRKAEAYDYFRRKLARR